MYSTSDKKFTEAAKTFISDLKKVYQASSREIAENYLLELMERKISFGHKIVAKQLGKFVLSISGQLGGSTNPIEETFTKTKGSFTSLYKLVYCAIKRQSKNVLQLCLLTISQLNIFFPNRLKIELN